MVKGIFLNIEVDPDVPEILNTDETRLRQVLINLVGNAFKFTFNGGVTIKVGLERSLVPCKVKFTVEDTGIGIKKEDQDKLFKLFGRLEQQDKKINTHGVGLGLTISNTLALLLDPSEKRGIQVASEYEKGTAFSFVVQSGPKVKKSDRDTPQAKLDESCTVFDQERKDSGTILEKLNSYPEKKDTEKFGMSARTKSKHLISNIESKDSIPPTPGTPIKLSHFNSTESIQDSYIAKYKKQPNNLFSVMHRGTPTNKSKFQEQTEPQIEKPKPICLIVDDNPFNLIVATNIMQEKGYIVKTALNGQEAIDRVKAQEDKPDQRFSVILMDCQMPVMDGYEATRNLTRMMKEGAISEIVIIALTANQRDDEHDKHCFEVGMKGVLGKPLDVGELKEILKKIIKNNTENN